MPTESSHCTLVPTLTQTPPRNEFQVTLVPMAPAHYGKMLPPMFANYDGDQKPSKFQRKQWKPTSENHFLRAFVIPLLTADLPVWKPRVSDPAGRSHIHCRFPSKKCVLCRSCCCPGWRRRERHYVMTKNNCVSLGFLTASLLCLPFCRIYICSLWHFWVTVAICIKCFGFFFFCYIQYPWLQVISVYQLLLVPHYT